MKQYKAILFHPEGDFVTDFNNNTEISDVWECIGNMGSRWIFYPICFVCTDKTIVDTPEGMEFLRGKRVKTVAKYLSQKWAENKENICNVIDGGGPLWAIYN